MKTHNQNPLWHSQPLRLTPAQTQNPNEVLNDFFQCYHLQDVRELMWQWLTAAVSSPGSNANDHHERNNYLFFYEKMESLVEAAWIMNRGTTETPNPMSQPPETAKNEQVRSIAKVAQPARFSKPARLLEKATSNPDEVIAEVFSHTPFDELKDDLLPNWLRVALINKMSPYTAAIDREILYEFHDQLLPFVEAVYCKSEDSPHYSPAYLNEEQLADPSLAITAFFQQCPIEYIRRELTDFLEAGIGYEGQYPNGFSPWQAWMAYNHILCLVEAAYQLYLNQQMQPVTQVLSQQMMELEEAG